MSNKKKIYISVASIVSLSAGIFYYNIKNNINLENISSISTKELLNIVEKDNYNKYKNIVSDYDLGRVLLGENEEAIYFDLKGTIGIPKEINNAPLIFILSGNNNSLQTNNTTKDTYEGLTYLVDKLSKAGYLTISINTDLPIEEGNEDYIVEDKVLTLVFKKHYQYLKDSISGKSNKYPVSLYNKGDINNIGLIGQSNTGRTIYNIANQEILDGRDNIKGLLSITPNGGTYISSYPDIPSSILSTEHSVDTSTSFDMYNDIEKSIDRKSFSQLTYLIGGNSNKFNNLVEDNTLEVQANNNLQKASMSTNEDTIQDEYSHQEFLSSYSIDFFDYIFDKNSENSLYDTNNPTVQKLYKKDILSKLFTSNRKEIFNINTFKDSKISFKDIKPKPLIESSISSIDTAINFNDPATNIELQLLLLDWKNKNASFNLSLDNKDFSEYKSISIEWSLNHASELSVNDIEKVSVILEDKDNKSEVILLDELPLNKIDGTPESIIIEDKTISNWSRFTPIGETRIPLELFEGIDLSNIENLSINFGENESGSIYLKNIHLNK